MRNSKLVLMAAVLPVLLVADAYAGDKVRNGAAASLNTDAAWGAGGAGTQPGAGDRAVWNSGSTQATAETLGGPVTWGGIMVSAATPSPGATINGTDTIGLGSLGISLNDGVTTNRRLTLSAPVNLLADQIWQLGDVSAQAGIQANGVISGSAKLTINPSPLATKLGVATFANGANTFSGGLTISPGANVTIASTITTSYVASGGNLTSGVFGTGTLRIDGGTVNTSNKILYNPRIEIGGDFTFGSTGRSDVGGGIDLLGSTRSLTLTRGVGASTGSVSTGGGNVAIRFQPQAGGLVTNTISNGGLRLVASSTVISAGSFSGVLFGAGTLVTGQGTVAVGTSFVDNSELVIGTNVFTSFGSSFPWGSGASQGDAPAVTVETGGLLNLSENMASRSPQLFSLSGSGVVLNLARTPYALGPNAVLNLNGRNKTTTSDFTGVIKDYDAAFAGAASTNTVSVLKNGSTTQIFSGANTYTGGSSVYGGVLSVGSIANGGAVSSIGASSASAGNLVIGGGTLRYTGAATTSDRLFTITTAGGTLESAGTGAIDFAATGSIPSTDPANRSATFGPAASVIYVAAEDLVAGMTISGTGIDANTIITAVDRFAGTVTLSQPTNVSANPAGATSLAFNTANRTFNLTGANADDNAVRGSMADSSGGGVLSVHKMGSGKWILSGTNTNTGYTRIDAGTLVLQGNASVPVTTNAGGAIVNGGLLVIEYTGTSPKTAIVDHPTDGLAVNAAGGFQTGRVRTTNAVDNTKAIGWLDDGTITFQTKYTWKGDADLSGTVTSTDFNALVAGYGTTAGGVWGNGDFNYDGKVNTLDFNLLAGNFGAPALGAPLGGAGLGSVVPEPASLSLLAIGALGLTRRRRD